MAFSGSCLSRLMNLGTLTNRYARANLHLFNCKFTACEQAHRRRAASGGGDDTSGGRWSEPGSAGFGPPASGLLVAIADQIAVHGVLGHLPPQRLIGAIGHEAVEQLLEPFVLGRKLGIEFGGGLVAAVHDLGR